MVKRTSNKRLLKDVFGTNATAAFRGEQFAQRFLSHSFSISDLQKAYSYLSMQSVTFYDANHQAGEPIPACDLIVPEGVWNSEKPVSLIVQVHGNEPAGLAAYLMILALKETNQLTRPVLVAIGSPLAAQQYFDAWQKQPDAHQATRDIYRAGVDEKGNRLRDPNRIPQDYAKRLDDPHSHRDHQLDVIADNVSGMLDIHSARGKLATVMTYTDQQHIAGSPIRSILRDIDEAIGANGNSISMAQLFAKHQNISHVTGIEAGTHEDPESFRMAAAFTLTWLYNLGVSKVAPHKQEKGEIIEYKAQKSLTFAQMLPQGTTLHPDELVYPVKRCAADETFTAADKLIVNDEENSLKIIPFTQWNRSRDGIPIYRIHQYEELEPIEKDQVVAISVPGGKEFKAPYDFAGVFVSKSSELYSDPAVYPWPIAADKLDAKFAYPCIAKPMQLEASAPSSLSPGRTKL